MNQLSTHCHQVSITSNDLNKTNNHSKHRSSIELELTDSELEYGFNTQKSLIIPKKIESKKDQGCQT